MVQAGVTDKFVTFFQNRAVGKRYQMAWTYLECFVYNVNTFLCQSCEFSYSFFFRSCRLAFLVMNVFFKETDNQTTFINTQLCVIQSCYA